MSSLLHPFQFENIPARGRLLRLEALSDHVMTLQDCAPATATLLAELLAAAALLVHDAKHEHSVNLQVQNVARKAMAFAHCSQQGHLKAFANEGMRETSFAELGNLPDSHFAVTLDNTNLAQPYQSLVGLHHPNASAALEHYFTTSVQTPTRFKVLTWRENDEADAPLHAGALFLQALPGLSVEDDAWHRLGLLMQTLTPAELANPNHPVETLLLNLFAEDTLRLSKPETFSLQADDPRPRMLAALANIPPQNLRDMFEKDDEITLTDQTSGKVERFTEADLQHLLNPDTTQH
ncbi:MAG: Hsp33 family molecular chaperone HslO [Alphaproteobacteria bacterium]